MPPVVPTRPSIRSPFPRSVRPPFSHSPPRFPAGQATFTPISVQRLFRVVFAGMMVWALSKITSHNFESVLGAVLIIGSAMLPSYLWISGKLRGLPLFPAYAMTCIWNFALPLITDNPIVTLFSGWNHLVAAASVAVFLLLGTLTSFLMTRRPAQPPAVCWMMDQKQGSLLLLVALGFSAVWTVVYTAGWISLSPGLDSIGRAAVIAVEVLSSFVLSYLIGSGALAPPLKVTFFVLLGIVLVAMLPNLLLIGAMSLGAVTMMAYAVGSKRLPWMVGIAALCIFGFLHLGKSEMRDRYWIDGVQTPVSPLRYFSFFSEWAGVSTKAMRTLNSDDEGPENLLERASLMHWMLYFQASSPSFVPYLHGESYALIPRLLLPRFIDPDKPRGNEGNSILSIHYGIQMREDAETTMISFGLLSEAFANFGFLGMAGLGLVAGAVYGKIAHWARGMPILSLRALFAVLVASLCFESEMSATSYVTRLFQSSMILLVFAAVFMRPRRLDSTKVSGLDR